MALVNRSLVILLLLFLLDRTFALSWLSRLKLRDTPNSNHGQRDSERNLDVLGLSGEFLNELDDLPNLSLNLEALKAYSFKPDCFKQAANKIISRCQELELDEEARVNAAIVMTMCEVATGQQYSLPLECMPYSTGEFDKDPIAINTRTRGKCVDALARSPQFWSSYSGYLREIPQLCHAYRRWNDIDLARNIYYNVTIEKIKLLNLLFDHEKKSERHLQDLVQQSEILRNTVHEMKNLAESHESSAGHLLVDIESGLHHVLDRFKVQSLEDLNNREEAESLSIAKFDASLEDVLVRNSALLNEIVASLNKIVRSHADELVASHNSFYEQVFRDLVTTQNDFMEIHQGFILLKQEVEVLLGQANDFSEVVAASLRDASTIRTIQAETSQSAVELIRTLGNLTDTTYAEIGKINASAFEIQQQLSIQQHPVVAWRHFALKILSILGQGSDLAIVQHLLSFRVLLSAISCLWVIFRFFVSSVMGTALSLLLSQSASSFLWKRAPAHPHPAPGLQFPIDGSKHTTRRLIYVSRIPRRLCHSE